MAMGNERAHWGKEVIHWFFEIEVDEISRH